MSTATKNGSPLSALRSLTAAHLDKLEQERLDSEQRRREAAAAYLRAQISQSRDDAIAFVAKMFPDTLDRVLGEDDWTGFASLPVTGTNTAVASLGEGIWVLYHYAVTSHRIDTTLHLVLACQCGQYIEVDCYDSESLAIALTGIDRWQADPGDCTKACSPATWPELPKEDR